MPDSTHAPELLDIAEVTELTGVAPSALRYYERLGLIEPAGRNGLRRAYDPTVVDRLALIVAGRATGFSLAQLHELLHAPPAQVRERLGDQIGQIDREIESLRSARALLHHALSCEHESMLECPTFTHGLRTMLPAGAGVTSRE
jgi:DNA-binding transcriptional MerR regulator